MDQRPLLKVVIFSQFTPHYPKRDGYCYGHTCNPFTFLGRTLHLIAES